MLFYLSKLNRSEQREFLQQAQTLLTDHANEFASRFQPALEGLRNVIEAKPVDTGHGKRLLGWTTSGHWLLEA